VYLSSTTVFFLSGEVVAWHHISHLLPLGVLVPEAVAVLHAHEGAGGKTMQCEADVCDRGIAEAHVEDHALLATGRSYRASRSSRAGKMKTCNVMRSTGMRTSGLWRISEDVRDS